MVTESNCSFQRERKIVATRLRRITYKYKTVLFDERSSTKRLVDQCLLIQFSLLSDLLSHSEVVQARRTFSSWLCAVEEIDLFDLGSVLKRADEYLKLSLEDALIFPAPPPRNYQQFKAAVSKNSKCWPLLASLSMVISRYFELRDVRDFRILSTWINFLRRMNPPDLDLKKECEQEYVAFEEGFEASYPVDTVTQVRNVLTRWFSNLTIEEFVPQHGPGSVAGHKGRLPLYLKYQELCTDNLLDYIQKDIGSLDTWSPLPFRRGLKRQSEIVCVPKSIMTNRVISREPVSLQYLQQGYKRVMVRHMHAHPEMRRHVRFDRQDLSQEMARSGSVDGAYATIDLSSASDSISFTLVKQLFKRCPVLLRGLWATRSTHTVLPSGRVLPLKKFAPMGSALCFPIQTSIFMACCEVACARAGVRANYRVYGDDIIIDWRATDALLRILDDFCFVTNKSKSFWKKMPRWNFREACGIECLDGIDVTPFRVPRFLKPVPQSTDIIPEVISSWISFANTAMAQGLRRARQTCLHLLSSYFDYRKLEFSEDGTRGIATDTLSCTNWYSPSRFILALPSPGKRNVYHRLERQVYAFGAIRDCEWCRIARTRRDRNEPNCPIKIEKTNWELIRYFEWLRRKEIGVCDPTNDHKHNSLLKRVHDATTHHTTPPVLDQIEHLIADERVTLCPLRVDLARKWVLA